ncbi:MAG: phosphosulfolactate synthase, partial [Bacilli bacterium]
TTYPGGTFFEVALNQNKIHQYVGTLQHLGITTVEISDGTIEITLHERRKWIKRLINEGFHVITEYGKKLAGSQIELAQLFETMDSDLECGAGYIIIEGRESGADVGIYNGDGETDTDILNTILSHPHAHRLIWEAPQKQQQVDILRLVGCRANLGNIAPQDIYGTESLRRGLRSDTFFFPQSEILR